MAQRSLERGRRFWALFDRDEGVWHERLVLHATAGGHVIVTPDGDVYEELHSDYEDMLESGVSGGIPNRLFGKKALRYAFRPGDMARDSAFRRRAEAQLPALLAGVPPDGLGADGSIVPLSPADGSPAAGVRAGRVAEGDPDFYAAGTLAGQCLAVGSRWFAGESAGPFRRGESITVSADDVAFGANGQALLLRGGVWLRICRDPPTPLPLDAAPPGEDDIRTLPVAFNSRGDRTRDFESSRNLLREEPLDDAWPVEGPRAVHWLVEAFGSSGMAPVPRHHWWRQALGATTSDPGIDEHLFLSEVLQHALQYDQLNVCNLASFECLARRYQLWEERYAERIRASTEGAVAAGLAAERHLFLGGGRAKGYALAAPELERWVAKRMEEEAAVLKERRKGREERALAAAATKAPRPPLDGDKDKNKKKKKDRAAGAAGSGTGGQG